MPVYSSNELFFNVLKWLIGDRPKIDCAFYFARFVFFPSKPEVNRYFLLTERGYLNYPDENVVKKRKPNSDRVNINNEDSSSIVTVTITSSEIDMTGVGAIVLPDGTYFLLRKIENGKAHVEIVTKNSSSLALANYLSEIHAYGKANSNLSKKSYALADGYRLIINGYRIICKLPESGDYFYGKNACYFRITV